MKSDLRRMTNIGILGSTGSIGTQTLDIIKEYPDKFRASVLTAGCNRALLAEQARAYMPDMVVIADESQYPDLKKELADLPIEIATGANAIAEAAAFESTDTIVTAMVGYSGLIPTVKGIEAGKRIALANKETLVVAGEVITALAAKHGVDIVPVDSEHSAIFQCLQGEKKESVRKLILTASGGPFRTTPAGKLNDVTAADALKHPNWKMGAKVTIDSASMMNKGFEMMEACWLFGFRPKDVDILVHPQSVVHSMVEFVDGSVKAQLAVPDMRMPIRYALGYPTRLATERDKLNLTACAPLSFELPDMQKFPLLTYAFDCMERGGNAPCVLNAANEVAVGAFLKGKIRFTQMPVIAEATLEGINFQKNVNMDTLIETNREARAFAEELVPKLSFKA